ncbi:hypothetical protein D9757_008195 [Collybiopsis confluens]|uniref:Uncharacterized protein n=1 Tax=Collybiopsis confluens TaxID=2823264 RepID=A0A8H5HBI8_9AGAR|nr:hypothetical protein D9757_008195 [Collybiopsis confluens]
MRFTTLSISCLIVTAHSVAGYRPFRRPSHRSPEDLAQAHRAPRAAKNDVNVNPTLTYVQRGPSYSHPTQIPPCGSIWPVDCQETKVTNQQVTRASDIKSRFPSRFERSMPETLPARQIHNADYSSSSPSPPSNPPPASSGSSNSTQQPSTPPHEEKSEDETSNSKNSAASDPSDTATDPRPSTKREQLSEPLDERRFPRAAAIQRYELVSSVPRSGNLKVDKRISLATADTPANEEPSDTAAGNDDEGPSDTGNVSSSKDASDSSSFSDDQDTESNPNSAPEEVKRRTVFRFRR